MLSNLQEKHIKRKFWYLLAALIAAAFVMRVIGSFWGLPLLLHPDEPATVDYAIEMLSRHSWMAQSFDRPDHFEIKCDAILFAIFSRIYYHQPAYEAFTHHAHTFYLIARLFSSVFGTALIPLTAAFTEALLRKHSLRYRETAALVAGCGVAFLPVFLRYSTLANPDVVLCFFVILFAWLLQRYLISGKSRYIFFADLAIAICVTIKYNGAILCLPLALAVIYRSLQQKHVGDIFRLGVISVLLVAAGIFVIAPNLFLDYKVVVASVLREARPNHLGADGLSFFGNFRFYLLDFANAFGIVTLALMLWGAILLLRERECGSLCMLVGLIYWICMSALKLHWSRWGIPIYPFYLILIGIALADISQRAQSAPKNTKAMSAAVSVFLFALLANVFLSGLSYTKTLSLPDSRNLALQDFQQLGITPENSLYEGYTPFDPAGYMDKTDAFRLSNGELSVTEDYADKKYFIMSDSFSARYQAEPERYAEKNAIYQAIAEQYPIVYRLQPEQSNQQSQWIFRDIANCIIYLTGNSVCSGSTITVYALPG